MAAPTTSGARVQRPFNPIKAARQAIQDIPDKELGKIVFNPPDHMIVGKEESMEAVITLTDVASVIARLKGKGKPQVEDIRVASRMRLRLIGPDFTIDDRSSPEQWVDASESTNWSWHLTPKRAGVLVLTLRATRVMEIEGDGQVPRDLPSLDRSIIVTSDYWYSSKHLLGDNRNLIAPAIVSLTISLIVPWIGNLRKKRRLARHRRDAMRRKLSS